MATPTFPADDVLRIFQSRRLWYCQSQDSLGLVTGLGYDAAHAKAEWRREYQQVTDIITKRSKDAKSPLVPH